MDIRTELGRRILFCDGAMGTMLQAAGLPAGREPELWNLERPEVVRALHGQYLAAGADILNVSGAAKTPEIVAHIREKFPDVPIIATGGPRDEDILRTIRAGANAITYTPPTTAQLCSEIMVDHRSKFEK